MDVGKHSSILFVLFRHWLVPIIDGQAQESALNAKATTSAPASTTEGVKEKTPKEHSKFFSFHSFILHYLFTPALVSVALAKVLSNMELDNIERARKVVADPTMAEITQEHPQGQSEYENAVRYHIISFTQRIGVSLSILDKLMELINASRKSAKDN